MTETVQIDSAGPSRRRRIVLAGVGGLGLIPVALLITGAFATGAADAQDEQEGGAFAMPPAAVDVAVARQETVDDVVRATGRIEAIQAVELRPDEPGRIVRLLFREGQTVAAGTPLIQIDDAMLRAQAERARADRDLAQQQRARGRRLRDDNATAPADLERAEAAARSAAAALALLELQIDRTTVRAPFGGVLGQGLMVRSAAVLVRVRS
jgi:membrane fusion protein, multidrug efflux system